MIFAVFTMTARQILLGVSPITPNIFPLRHRKMIGVFQFVPLMDSDAVLVLILRPVFKLLIQSKLFNSEGY